VGLLAALGAFSLSIIETLGYAGVFLLMVGESMILPVPSEAVLPFAGFLAARGTFHFGFALAAATAGTLVGSVLSYYLGYAGVRPALERWGRYVLVTPHHLDVAHSFFERRGAAVAVFLSRFVPVVRHLISIPAGSARMPMTPFVIATVLGGGLWNLTLLYAGYALGEHWETVTTVVDEWRWVLLGAAAVAILVVAVALVRRRRPVTP
jgi:membrane protein DedA with SNARE-associated domain